jgi:hypothetical protein
MAASAGSTAPRDGATAARFIGKKFFASFFQERRLFFSEEKKQKTFDLDGSRAEIGRGGLKPTPRRSGN